jgi:sigma-B regulation protein RsbU (phosphoserine phosphatase)
MFRLFSLEGKKLYNWTLSRGAHTLGRSSQSDLVIDDGTVSRRHARIEVTDEDTVNLTDLGSHNGTSVNGYAITARVELKPNDLISFGRVQFRIIPVAEPKVTTETFSVGDSDQNLAHATLLPLKEALRPLSAGITDNPKVFQAISEMGRMLILPGSDQEMFGRALELLQEAVPVERAAILLCEAAAGQQLFLAASRASGRRSPGSFTISRTVVRELLNQRNAILISDPKSDSRFAQQQSIVGSGIRSVMAVPLFDQEKVLGILYADTTNPLHHYSEDSLRVAATFGNILAAKIGNQRLLQERQAKEVLEAELKVACQIQNQLLPAGLPRIEGYSLSAFQAQCKAVGGDLYDVAQLADGSFLLLLADVSGKGMGAALLMSNVLAAFRILYGSEDLSLLEMTSRVSGQLVRSSRPEDFATLFICRLYPQTHTLRYLNAGHNPPMMVRNSGELEELESSGIPIGAFDLSSWRESTLQFGAGDLLFMFTDGISEAVNPQGEMYQDRRLKGFLLNSRHQSPEELTESVLDEIRAFMGSASQSDDITTLALRRDG